MSKGIIETIGGAALIATGVAIEILSLGYLTSLAWVVGSAGAGLLLSGIGTLLSKGPLQGFATTTRNPVAPWEIVYGRARVGGTIVYISEFGTSNKWLDMVIVLAAHPCNSVDELLFDNQRVQIGAHNSSFTPVQQTVLIDSPSDITRVGTVVTIHLNHDIPLLSNGDRLIIEGVHPVALGINGTFPVTIVSQTHGSPGNITFSFLAGGGAIPPGVIVNSGQVRTTWADYKANVYMEALLGTQTLGTTFTGMTNGTPKNGDPGNLIRPESYNIANPWTSSCSLVGMTAVFIRLEYDPAIFPGGIPQISFLVKGKNDITDYRNSPPSRGYSENAALCIADYLSNTTWGFKAAYGTEINTANLIAAANICDEAVPLASPLTSPYTTEPRYTCCGHFPLTMKRGEVLQNLLTSCAGRVTYTGGQFSIWPASWAGVSLTLASNWVSSNSAGPIRWRSTVSISNLYNGVKGTYVSPVNNWQSSDFPRYAQDALHGYNNGPSIYQYDANLAADGGDRRWLDVQFPFTISCPTAQRLAKIELLRRRQQGTGTFLLNMAGYQIAALDVVQMSLAYFGWTNKYLEVLATRFKIEKQQSGTAEVVLLGVEIDVQESDPSVYNWAIIEELSPQGYQHPGVPDDLLTPDPPANLMLTFDPSGNSVLTWTAPLDAYVTTIEGRYQPIASPPGIWIALGEVNYTVTQLTLPVLLAGTQYILELRSLNGAGVPSVWVSINYTPLSLPSQWMPYQVQADPADALFPGEYTFDVALSYVNRMGAQNTMADGSSLARVNVTGANPTNKVIPGCPPPVIVSATVATTGGLVKGGIILYVQVGADDGAGNYSLPAAVFPVQIPAGTNTNLVTLQVIWPAFAGLVNYTVYASSLVDLICAQGTGTLTAASPGPYTPSSLTVGAAAIARSTYGPPNPNLRTVRIKGTIAYHLGVLGAGVTSASGSTIVSNDCVDVSGLDNWAGRVLTIIGRNNTVTPISSVPFGSWNITAFNPATGTFTLDRPVTGVLFDDAFVVCTLGYDNSADPYRLTDAGWSNSLNYNFLTHAPTPHSGLTVNAEKQMQALVIKGTSRGAKANITSNTGTQHVLDAPIVLKADSVWIIIEAGFPYTQDSTPLDNGNPFHNFTMVMPVDNFANESMFLKSVLVDFTGSESEDGDGPTRMFYAYGQGLNQRTVTASTTVVVGDQTIECDTTAGSIIVHLLPSAQTKGQVLYVQKVTSDANTVTISPFGSETVNGVGSLILINQWDVAAIVSNG